MSTQQDQAAAVVNEMISIAATLYGIKGRIDALSAAWTNLSVANIINAFPTAPKLTNGGLGTADVSSTVANPIDTRVAVGNLVTMAISPNNFANILTMLQGISTGIGGGAVSANGAAVQLIALTH